MMNNKAQIGILDYGVGNIFSIENAFRSIGVTAKLIQTPKELEGSNAIVFPGVGNFSRAISEISKRQLSETLQEIADEDKKPILGFCLGMQLFADTSTESGNSIGLSWMTGNVKKLPLQSGLTIPHVGWETVQFSNDSVFNHCSETFFYFDHSYYFDCDTDYIIGTVEYGKSIPAVVRKKRIVATQFHPEKSQLAGQNFLRAFMTLV